MIIVYGGLRSTPEYFVKYIYIYELEKIFNSNFENISTGPSISQKLYSLINKEHLEHPCSQFPKDYALKLFIKLKIFYTIKYTNRDLKIKQKDKKTIRKLNILSHI